MRYCCHSDGTQKGMFSILLMCSVSIAMELTDVCAQSLLISRKPSGISDHMSILHGMKDLKFRSQGTSFQVLNK